MTFEDWTSFEGSYKIKSFDGAVIYDGRESIIEVETDRYQSIAGLPLSILNFKLFDAYTSSGSHRWNFGPVKEFGASSAIHTKQSSTYTYDCKNERFKFQGKIYSATLHLEVKQMIGSPEIAIQYQLEIPGITGLNSHRYVLERISQ